MIDANKKTALGGPAWQLKDATIMIVDNEPINMEVIQIHLESAGYRKFITTNQPAQTVSLLRKEQPDLLLVALMMPEVTGLDILSAVHEDEHLKQISVIIVTSSTDTEIKHKALELGVADFLSRPVDASELLLRVRNTLMAKAYVNLEQPSSYGLLDGIENETASSSSENEKSSTNLVCQLPLDNPRIRALVERFRVRLNEQLHAMDAAREAKDFEELATLAHWLKGSGGTVGFSVFTDPARDLEQFAKKRNEREIDEAISTLHQIADRIILPGE